MLESGQKIGLWHRMIGEVNGLDDCKSYYTALPARLIEYINDETGDSLYYQELARQLKDPSDQEMVLEFARDEAGHANAFRQVYRQVTGTEAPLARIAPPRLPGYCAAIKERIRAESDDLVKYGQEAAAAFDPELQKLFYLTSLAEGKHGLRLTTLLCGVK